MPTWLSLLPLKEEYISLPLKFEFGHMTCLGPWDMKGSDVSRSLKHVLHLPSWASSICREDKPQVAAVPTMKKWHVRHTWTQLRTQGQSSKLTLQSTATQSAELGLNQSKHSPPTNPWGPEIFWGCLLHSINWLLQVQHTSTHSENAWKKENPGWHGC